MKKNIKLIIGISIFAVIIILLSIWSLRSEHIEPIPTGTVGNTAGNANNGGYFCEYDGVVYFANPYDNGTLYSMLPDESKITKLSSISVSNLNAGGDYLFYFQQEASGSSGLGYVRSSHGLFRTTLDGKHVSRLTDDYLFNVQLVDNYLYYLSTNDTGSGFFKQAIDGSDPELLTENGWNFACAQTDGTVYYNGDDTNHYLYRYDTRTGSSSVVWEGNIWYPVYDNGYVYYLDVANDYRLCRYSLSEDKIEVLTHDRVDCFNLAGGYIYYQKNSISEPALKRMTLSGQDAEVVAEGNYTRISATSRYVYFSLYDNEMLIYRTPINGPVSVSSFSAAQTAAMENMEK